jgi:hypothetical protein
MSLFDYPRINFKGTIQLNPGTANNDDYAQQPGALVLPASYGSYAGQFLGLIDSKTVQPRTFGMTDADFIAWIQKTQTFDVDVGPGQPAQTRSRIPAEWNYYGDMKSSDIKIAVVGVQTGPDPSTVSADATAVIGATLTYLGTITDVNSEGSPPATQFFIDTLTLKNGGKTLLSGTPSKGASQWLNFYRNVNLQADGGAGAYVYHVMKKSGDNIQLPGFDDPRIIGVICRYYLYRFRATVSKPPEIEQRYQNQEANPGVLEIVGTFAPLFADDKIITGPVGRLLVANDTTIPTPSGTQNNGAPSGLIALAPAVLQSNGNAISVDFSGTFPDYFTTDTAPNPKYDFGKVTLVVSNATGSAEIGPVDYTDTDSGNRRGWIFDFDISSNAAAQKILQDPEAKFSLRHATLLDPVLDETDYYFVSNQQGIYAEQNGPGDSFLNQGSYEPATVAVYHRGLELSPAQCPPINVWQYRSVPIQSPGDVESILPDFKPGQPLQVNTSQPGNFLLTFSIGTAAGFPPQNYNTFMNPPYITNAPSISLRILPNDEDFSSYYTDPSAAAPVGNAHLTFDVVYQKVLRTYYLLYPVMNSYVALNSEAAVAAAAPAILAMTDPTQTPWMSSDYMPRTRDMSASRRTLLQAWCRKVSPGA